MDIKQLRYFVTIVNTKSFTAAARFLYVSQSALGKSMKELGDELKVQLIYFSGKKLYTTSYGTELYNIAQNLLIQYDMIEPTINGIKHLQKGLLRIGLPPIIGTSVFPELISGFVKKYPGIELIINQYKATVIQQMVAGNLLDFGFTLLPVPDNIETIPIIQSHYVLVAHRDDPITQKKYITYGDLRDKRFILPDESFKFYNIIMMNCQKANFIPNILMRLQDWDLIIRLIQQNIGITILPKPIVDLYQVPDCVSIPIDDPSFTFDIVMVSPKQQYETHACIAFKEHVISQVNEHVFDNKLPDLRMRL